MNTDVLIIGLGNRYRSDDGLGQVVANELQGRLPSGCRAIAHSGEASSLMECWVGANVVVLIDAACSGQEPGTLHRFDATVQPLPEDVVQCSTHGFGATEAIEMARALNVLPTRMIVWAMEAKSFEPGETLSHEVAQAVPELVRRLVDESVQLVAEVKRA